MVLLNNLTEPYSAEQLSRFTTDALLTLKERVEDVLNQRRETSKTNESLLRTFEDYEYARQESDAELPYLTAALIASGRQFKLDKYQRQVLEARFGSLASSDGVVYNTVWDMERKAVISFSFQCNVPKTTAKRSAMTTAVFIRDAAEFFHTAEQAEVCATMRAEEEALNPETAKKKSTKKKAKSGYKLLSLDELDAKLKEMGL